MAMGDGRIELAGLRVIENHHLGTFYAVTSGLNRCDVHGKHAQFMMIPD